jgi:hypothetical protein
MFAIIATAKAYYTAPVSVLISDFIQELLMVE